MSKATLLYLKERPVNSESQGSQSNPRCHDSAGAVTKEQKRPDTIARHQSKSGMPTPSLGDSAKPIVNSSGRGQGLDGPTEVPGPDMHTPSHSPAPKHTVHDEGCMPVVSSSKEHNAGITGNEVTTPQHFRIQKELTRQVKSQDNDRDIRSEFCPHILHEPYHPVPIAVVNRCPTGSRPSLFVPLCKKLMIVSDCSAWKLSRRPIPTRRCLA